LPRHATVWGGGAPGVSVSNGYVRRVLDVGTPHFVRCYSFFVGLVEAFLNRSISASAERRIRLSPARFPERGLLFRCFLDDFF